jgi:tetratricopeptide (TPR) repeat protein
VKTYIGLTALSLMLVAVGFAAQSLPFSTLSASPTQVSIVSSPSSSAAVDAAAPSVDAGNVLLPRPRLQSPLIDALRQTANASPPGNFPFQTVASADHLVTLHYYSRSIANANDMLAAISGILRDRLQPHLGLTLKHNVDIWIYNSRSEFLAGTNPNSPQITGAYTNFDGSSIYMPVYSGSDSTSVFAHELTHAVVIQNYDPGQLTYGRFPIWTEEGLAESSVPDNGLYASFDDAAVRNALARGGFVDIFSIFSDSYPQNPDTDNLCYAEARAFFKYMLVTYGQAKFQGFIHDHLDGDLDYATLNNFGVDLQTLKGQWLGSLKIGAPAHAKAVFPTLPTPQAFTPGKLSGLATQTQPVAAEGGEAVFFDAMVKLGALLGLLALIVAIIEISWRAIRRRRERREALAASLALAPLVTWRAPVTEHAPYMGAPPFFEAPPPAVAAPMTVPLNDQTPPARRRLEGARAWELVAFALLFTIIFGVGVVETRLDPAQLWRHAYLAAGIVALADVVVVGALLWRAVRAYRNPSAHVVVLIALLAVAGWAYFDGRSAGATQGLWFDDHGAYTLAYSTLRDASAPNTDVHRTQVELADAAHTAGDYAAAVEHYHQAIVVAPTRSAAESDRAARLKVTQEWGKRLVDAHTFDQAIAVYQAALTSGDCVADCPAALREASGAAYIEWAQDLIAAKRVDEANAKLQALTGAYPDSEAAASAKLALDASGKGLASALVARKSGDIAAMNLILRQVAYAQPDSVDAAIATAFSQPVSGQIVSSYLYGPTTHILLFAFQTDAQAAAFHSDRVEDTSLFKVAAVADAKGQFTAYAPTGYVYVPVWETQSQDGRPGWHYTNGASIHVAAFTPVTDLLLHP